MWSLIFLLALPRSGETPVSQLPGQVVPPLSTGCGADLTGEDVHEADHLIVDPKVEAALLAPAGHQLLGAVHHHLHQHGGAVGRDQLAVLEDADLATLKVEVQAEVVPRGQRYRHNGGQDINTKGLDPHLNVEGVAVLERLVVEPELGEKPDVAGGGVP